MRNTVNGNLDIIEEPADENLVRLIQQHLRCIVRD